MPQVKIIRAAFREIQKLPRHHLESVYKILRRLSQQENTDTIYLTGYDNLLRTRLGNLRVIWQQESSGCLLMIQQVLKEPEWINLMKPEDFRALSPLIWNHVNPYGTFKLDMNERLPIETMIV